MSTKSSALFIRTEPETKAKLEQVASANGLSSSAAVRLAITLLIAKYEAESGVILPTPTPAELSQQQADDLAAVASLLHPILVDSDCANFRHRENLIGELVAEDTSLASTCGRALRYGLDFSEFLRAVVADKFDREPGARVWPALRQDVYVLALRYDPTAKDRAHIWGSIDRLDDCGRWRLLREYLKSARARDNVELEALFERTDDGEWRMLNRPSMQIQNVKSPHGGYERYPVLSAWSDLLPPPIPTRPLLTDDQAVDSGLRSPQIGAKTTRARGRNTIGGIE